MELGNLGEGLIKHIDNFHRIEKHMNEFLNSHK